MIEILNTGYNNIKEIDNIQFYDTGEDILRGICYRIRQDYERIVNIKFDTLIFDGVVAKKYPGKLARLIKKEKLGKLVASERKYNPNSGHYIKVYIWSVDKKVLNKWFKRNRHKKESDNE